MKVFLISATSTGRRGQVVLGPISNSRRENALGPRFKSPLRIRISIAQINLLKQIYPISYGKLHQLDLTMKDRVKSTKNKISIISWKIIPHQDLNPRPPTPQSTALPSVLSHNVRYEPRLGVGGLDRAPTTSEKHLGKTIRVPYFLLLTRYFLVN